MRNRAFKWLSHACRIVLGVTFIFSGFVKTVDPWGTAIKIQEYLSIYGLESLSGLRFGFSIWLCGAELMMGLMLLFKVRIRLISIFALASMIFFTVLTFLSATWLPVEDCGCFGDAVKLTPWETFAKNLVLLPLSVVVWWRYRRDRIFAFSKAEVGCTVLFFSLAMGYSPSLWALIFALVPKCLMKTFISTTAAYVMMMRIVAKAQAMP